MVIHSSPFLRCLQTSVAIGSGIAQYSDASHLRKPKTTDLGLKANSASIPELEGDEYSVKALDDDSPDQGSIKTVMRVDAFLGEWLTPDYFDHITPPPNSTMMVASAKSHLLRREQLEVFKPSPIATGQFPGGWKPKANRQVSTAVTSAIDDSIAEEENVEYHHHRAASQSVTRRDSSRDHRGLNPLPPLPSRLRPTDANYIPPIPAYSIRPSDPIPRGYCVHARDACTDIDLHWDSVRSPQDWGDGGELGEEWSAMHKRFRNGLSKMNSWYKEHLPEFHPEKEDPMALKHDDEHHDYAHDDHDDEEYELVLLIVTHAAGCNALMGALTNQPVLMDFGLTSLSMAVRKQVAPRRESESNRNGIAPLIRQRSSVDVGLADEYEVKIMASANHLRIGPEATIAQGAHLQSPHLVPQIPEYKQRVIKPSGRAMGAALNGDFNSDARRTMNSSLGSIRRSSLTPTPTSSYRANTGSPGTSASGSSGGLWSRNGSMTTPLDEMQELDLGSPAQTRPDPSNSDTVSLSIVQAAPLEQAGIENRLVATPSSGVGRTLNPNARGLWGAKAASTSKEVVNMRAKRRWTLHEEDDGHYLE